MKYVKAIFENENVQSLTTSNEELINYATECLINYNAALESDILENLLDYTVEGDLTATFENIRNTVVNANVSFMQEVSSVLASSDLSDEEKVGILESRMSSVRNANKSKAFFNRQKLGHVPAGAAAAAKGTSPGGLKMKNKDRPSSGNKTQFMNSDQKLQNAENKMAARRYATTKAVEDKARKVATAKKVGAGLLGAAAVGAAGKAAYDHETESLAEKVARKIKG